MANSTSSSHHCPSEYSPVFSSILTDTSALSPVRGSWDPHRLNTVVQATRIHDVHCQGDERGSEKEEGIKRECLRFRGMRLLSSKLPTCAYCGPEGGGWDSCLELSGVLERILLVIKEKGQPPCPADLFLYSGSNS